MSKTSDLLDVIGRYGEKIKVDANFSWYWPWLWGLLFTVGFVDPNLESFWNWLVFLLVWPVYLGEAVALW